MPMPSPRRRLTRLALAALVCLPLGACSDSHDDDEDAGGIMFDPRFADAGTDAGSPPTSIGEACTGDEQCMDPNSGCITEWPDGYCVADCSAGEACPDGTVCAPVGRGQSLCLSGCDPSAGGDQCRPGYGCAGEGTQGVCIPGCEEDADCGGAPLACFPGGNGGSCRTPGVEIGAACAAGPECGESQSCLDEEDWGFPGGTCGAFSDCDADTDAGCPGDAACFRVSFGGGRTFGVCVDGCETDADCTRPGYECTARDGRSSFCGPAFDPADLGVACSADRDPCTGGTCLSESDTGYPDSMCVEVGCDPALQTGCGGGGVCVDVGGVGVCHPGCAGPTDCRDGYDCAPSVPGDASSPTACQPGCDDASVCGNPGFQCNLGTGLCRTAFDDRALGQPCASTADDCAGGRCQSEADDGWPAGTCAFPGCRLSGAGPAASCPMGSACVDDGEGDPALGVCVPACETPSECRAGYTCDAGACAPECQAGDCTDGRTCDTTTGLCRS